MRRLLPSWPRQAAAALAAAALAVSGASRADAAAGWQANDDDSLLLELHSGKYRLGDTLRGYQTPTGVCVDMADVIQAMNLPVRLDRKSRRATGWIFSESERFTLDRDSNTVQNMNKSARIGDGDLRDTPEGWCVDLGALSGWFGVTFRSDLSNMVVRLETERTLPFIEALERRSRAARLRPQGETFDLARLPQADLPYRNWRMPSVDVTLSAAWRQAGPGRGSVDTRYEAYVSGEALGASYDARLTSDSRGLPEALRLRVYRSDPDGEMLGPLAATHVAAGDVESFAGALTGQSAVGRGVFLSNRPLARASRFAATTLRGELPAGWDAELYRNGQLLAFQADRGDGRYEFPDIDLRIGDNAFEVVLYGPQGQIRRENSAFPIDAQSVPAGKTWYWASMIQPGRDLIDLRRGFSDPLTGWRWGVGVERGIDKRTSLGLGLQSLMLGGKRRNYAELTLRRGLGPLLVELAGAQQFGHGGGQALSGQALGKIAGINIKADVLWVHGGYESEVVSARQSTEMGLTLDADVRLGAMRVPLQGGIRRTASRDGAKVNEWFMRSSLNLKGLALTAELANRQSSGGSADTANDGMRLTMLANTRLGRVRLRGNAKFRLSGTDKGFESVEANVDAPLGPQGEVRGTVEYRRASREVEFGLGYVRQFKRFSLRGDGTLSNRGAIGLGLSLAMSFGPDPVDGGWRLSGNKLAQYGQAAVTVFRDENADGVRQPDEEPVAGVEIASGGGLEQKKTDASGRTVIDGLRPFTRVLVSVDESSIEDPLLLPRGKGVVVVPRPGVAAEVELALAPTGEVEGTLLGSDGEPRDGAVLELVDEAGSVAARVQSEFDGYFLFDRVAYGAYRLRLSPVSAQALGAAAELGVAPRLDRTNPSARTGTIRLQPARLHPDGLQAARGAPDQGAALAAR